MKDWEDGKGWKDRKGTKLKLAPREKQIAFNELTSGNSALINFHLMK